MFLSNSMLFLSLMRLIPKTLQASASGLAFLLNLRTLCAPRVQKFAHPCSKMTHFH